MSKGEHIPKSSVVLLYINNDILIEKSGKQSLSEQPHRLDTTNKTNHESERHLQ